MGLKIYAWLYGLFSFFVILTDSQFYSFDFIYSSRKIISLLLLTGTLLYVYKKAILSYIFWRVLLICAIMDESWSLINFFKNIDTFKTMALMKIDEMDSSIITADHAGYIVPLAIFLALFGLALIIPCFYAVYMYSFKSKEVWVKYENFSGFYEKLSK